MILHTSDMRIPQIPFIIMQDPEIECHGVDLQQLMSASQLQIAPVRLRYTILISTLGISFLYSRIKLGSLKQSFQNLSPAESGYIRARLVLDREHGFSWLSIMRDGAIPIVLWYFHNLVSIFVPKHNIVTKVGWLCSLDFRNSKCIARTAIFYCVTASQANLSAHLKPSSRYTCRYKINLKCIPVCQNFNTANVSVCEDEKRNFRSFLVDESFQTKCSVQDVPRSSARFRFLQNYPKNTQFWFSPKFPNATNRIYATARCSSQCAVI